jgi:hypothetical protein
MKSEGRAAMSELARGRDWLAELRGAAEAKDAGGFKELVIAVAKDARATELKDEVCKIASELLGDDGAWATGVFFTEGMLREAHKAEALRYNLELKNQSQLSRGRLSNRKQSRSRRHRRCTDEALAELRPSQRQSQSHHQQRKNPRRPPSPNRRSLGSTVGTKL